MAQSETVTDLKRQKKKKKTIVQSDSSIRGIKSSSTCEEPVVENPMTPFLVTFGQNVDHSVRLTPEANVALMNFV